jgi:hypothetical protein
MIALAMSRIASRETAMPGELEIEPSRSERISDISTTQSPTNVLRNHSPDWQPTPHMVTSAAGAIKANQSAAAEAASRLREINAALWSIAPTEMILMPGSNPIGYVHGRAGSDIQTLNARAEFDLVLTRLIIHAEPVSYPRYPGQAFLRRDGVLVGIRESWDSGPTIDILEGKEAISSINKIHVRNGGKSFLELYEQQFLHKGTTPMHGNIIRRNVAPVGFPNLDEHNNYLRKSFRDYCHSYVTDPGEPMNFYPILQVLTRLYGSDRAMMEAALRYLLTHFLGNGLAPMNFENAVDYEYGPVTKYGVRPQEIIDNIVEAWRMGGNRFVDSFELMFGWERDGGAFIEEVD